MDTTMTSDLPTHSTTDTPESPQQRLKVLARRMAATREEAAAGIRLRHPEYDEDQVRWALFRAYLRDDDLFHVVWPDAPPARSVTPGPRLPARIGRHLDQSTGRRLESVRPLDTSPEAYQVKLEIDRSMTMSRRLQLASELADTAREAAAAGIRMRHPEYDEDQLRWALFRHSLHDDNLFRDVWPEAPLLAP